MEWISKSFAGDYIEIIRGWKHVASMATFLSRTIHIFPKNTRIIILCRTDFLRPENTYSIAHMWKYNQSKKCWNGIRRKAIKRTVHDIIDAPDVH